MKALVARLLMFAPLLLLAPACQPLSKYPLIEPGAAKQDERLYGVWVSVPDAGNQEKDVHLLHIGPSQLPLNPTADAPEPGAMQATFTNYRNKTHVFDQPFTMYFVTSQIKHADLASISEGLDPTYVAKTKGNMTAKIITEPNNRFWFLRYEVNGDTLKVWSTPNLEVIDRAITAGKLHGKVIHKPNSKQIESIDIYDETPKLAAFFAESLDLLFDKNPAVTYRRADILPK